MTLFTELVLAVEFTPDTPDEVINWLRFVIDEHDPLITQPVKRPEHPVFKERKAAAPVYLDLFHGSSDRFPGASTCRFELQESSGTYHLTLRSAVKNYQREVEAFLMFLMPYVQATGLVGYFRKEIDELPSLICYPEPGKLVVYDKLGDLIAMVNGQIKPLVGDE